MKRFAHWNGKSPASILLVLTTLTSPGLADVFTSSNKILELADMEWSLLDGLRQYIRDQNNDLQNLSQLLLERSRALQKQQQKDTAQHPNGAYLLIKHFTERWRDLTDARPALASQLDDLTPSLPTREDVQGAALALVRLQRVYRLDVDDMLAGNYSGFLGPPLSTNDAFQLGRQAFMDGYLPECIQWLELVVRLKQITSCARDLSGNPGCDQGRQQQQQQEEEEEEDAQDPENLEGMAASLLGRAYLFMDNVTKAEEMYDLSKTLVPTWGDTVQLGMELAGEEVDYSQKDTTWDHSMSELCSRPKQQRVAKMEPHHVCRYKKVLGLPYLRYKEEILSVDPYASLFYDVIRDDEIETIQEFVKGNMNRGEVGSTKSASISDSRTSDLGWLYDGDLDLAATLSQRVKVITGLEVDHRLPDGPSSAEALQVVNYGLGGHYEAHMDPFNEPLTEKALNRSGNRIATFLMYMSDVEKGGSTVFLNANISVAPVKGMALFWYSYKPDMNLMDQMTTHAGCPVLFGHKWIANKWIWTYGNTFRRPCGSSPRSTQLDVERIVQACPHPVYC